MALQLICLSAAALTPPVARHGLRFSSFYGMGLYNFDDPAVGFNTTRPWINLQLEGLFSDQVMLWRKFGVPSLFGDLTSAYTNPLYYDKIFLRHDKCTPASYPVCALAPEWEAAVEEMVRLQVAPGIANGTLLGVFLGDELCCEDTSQRTAQQCWTTIIAPVADKLRALLGPQAILYTNECGGPAVWGFPPGGKVPAALDLISIDYYAGWLPHGASCPLSANATCPDGATDPPLSEVTWMQQYLKTAMAPVMEAHQGVMLVPGTFGCHEVDAYGQRTPMSNESMAEGIIAKLDAYLSWAQKEPRIVGFNPWHFNNRNIGEGAHGAPCDMNVGIEALPGVLRKMQELGLAIVSSQGTRVAYG